MLPLCRVATELADITFLPGPWEEFGVAWKQQSSHLEDPGLQVVQKLEGSEDGHGKHRDPSHNDDDDSDRGGWRRIER